MASGQDPDKKDQRRTSEDEVREHTAKKASKKHSKKTKEKLQEDPEAIPDADALEDATMEDIAESFTATKVQPTPKSIRLSKKSMSSDGKVFYPSGEGLERPILPPKDVARVSLLIAIAAAVIGAIFLSFYLDGVINGPAREQQMLEESIQKEVDLGLPDMQALVPLDDAAILATLQESGATLYEKSPVGSEKPFEVIKLPPDVSLVDAAALYLKGVSSLSPSEAALLLNGSWDLTVNREKGMNMGIHYADFRSGSLERAIGNAAHSQGFDTSGDIESGEDSSGNTYMSGAIEIAGAPYSWRVSAVPLSAVYSQTGLPEDAAYVGIRIYS